MPISDTVDDVLNQAREVYLNDIEGVTYTDNVLLPYVKAVYSQYQSELEVNGLQFINSIKNISVTAGTTILITPADFMYPISLQERDSGSTDNSAFMEMEQREWEPSRQQTNTLGQWVFRNGEVRFLGSTADREVKLYYQSIFPSLLDGSSLVKGNCITFLAARTAAMAFLFLAQNETLAQVAEDVAKAELEKIIRVNVKRSQSLSARRKPYRPFWR